MSHLRSGKLERHSLEWFEADRAAESKGDNDWFGGAEFGSRDEAELRGVEAVGFPVEVEIKT